MLKSQKRDLLELVRSKGLDPSAFVLSEAALPDHSVATLVSIRNAPLYFRAVAHPSSWNAYFCDLVTFSPSLKVEPVNTTKSLPWKDVLLAFQIWLAGHAGPYLAEESLPDPWLEVSASPLFADLDPPSSSTHEGFSPPEQEAIRVALLRFRNLVVADFGLEARQLASLDSRVAYLSEAVARVSRFDWKNLALSSLVTVATALSLSTEQGRHLGSLFKHALSSILGLPP